MIKKILFSFLLLLTFTCYSQNIRLSDQAEVSILTCGTGNESYSLYGHTAVRIKDIPNQLDIVYNYGTFDFETPNFILKFVKGDLQYFMSVSNYPNFEYGYRYENRSIYEQKLQLTLTKKQQLFESLNSDLQSENRFYTYKFIDRNCTNMVVDKLNTILSDTIIQTQKPVEITYREILFPYSKNHFWEQLGINIIFGTKVDQKAERLFLPFEFLESLKNTTLDNKPLVSETTTLFEAKPVNYTRSFFNSIYLVIILLLILVLLYNKSINLIYFGFVGLIGVFLCGVGFYSLHKEVMWNYNALLFNPLYFVFLYYYYKNNNKKMLFWGKIIAGLLLVYLLYILNKVHLYLMTPFIVTHFIFLSRIIVTQKKG
ncbi:MAG: hypothetical protein CMP76_11195 [Flavobacterium sp.]|uniref:lipoprotein N-acyltransferase Lnb domain-containing protein n=1 Tax=Flavobacterium sp. TaxID=239 RepID=UPI000C48DD60|nr:DUF4105 domain-containing protein [Flavobacterium sp.]MBF03851.1 hypothetical protein [Flavobacterium sp.]